ncbi:epoxyqueuosine reductase QueH [Formicincola oecophyllae]|uniref:Epoxyqueuosine reductase QueH n=1 Tax=Formicincola oecophyllae TaxID=2558361 RepID=A0A4Y6U8A4_9PROT|nr:epoxyqueuosine reductase QueH [Formicincola oecophyllae]QDH13669.1 epoxyqueuosine reductase QueH [Formicincola oecophyllae]
MTSTPPTTRPKLTPPRTPAQLQPGATTRVLLHSCCAPCSGEIMEALSASRIDYTIFFYNPNIHPRDEYELRKNENIAFARKNGIPFFDGDYDSPEWFRRAKGLEMEPERGARCTMCFDMRLERAALFAHENGFQVMTSSLAISRWKNMAQVNGCGHKAASHYDNLVYWDFNWRKGGGSARQVEIAKREHFYKQEYCGCVFSLRDSNAWRAQKGLPPIEPGTLRYGVEGKLAVGESASSPLTKKETP